MILICTKITILTNSSSSAESPIWLYVQSISIDALDTLPCSQIISDTGSAGTSKRTAPEDVVAPASYTMDKKATVDLDPPTVCTKSKKKRRVRFTDPDEAIIFAGHTTNDISVVISEKVARQTTSEINLCQTKNICHYLKQNLQICGKSLDRHCVGYLESPKLYRHIFYLQEKSVVSTQPKGLQNAATYSISDLMSQTVDDTLDVVDQLKLAQKAALAILQFNDTPWLAQRWRLNDLSYFGQGNYFNENVLKTLHLSSAISTPTKQESSDMEDVVGVVRPFSEEDLFGINNMTMFSLGVALLELAHWKPVESFRDQHDPNAIITARRLVKRRAPLGSKYQDIARKCLECNFGFGTDLNKKELQAAVYDGVVCQLEKLIDTLSIANNNG